MTQKRRSNGKNALRSFAEAGKLGFFFLAATALPMRSPGQQLVALGEGLERLFSTAKSKIEAKNAKKISNELPIVEPTVETVETDTDKQEPQTTPAPPAAERPEESDDAPEFTANGDLGLIDTAAEPERYAELLELEKKGKVTLIRRYRRSYESRLIQSKDPMQEYYSGLKNALLRYKGVKSRVSWANETFHQGRNHLAKIIVKTSCLYVYLSLDPALLKGTKYESAVDDVSGTKKFGEFPTVIKIKGERKYKYALELIDRICAEELSLPQNKKFEQTDYSRPYMSDEELAKAGLVKLLVAVPEGAKE